LLVLVHESAEPKHHFTFVILLLCRFFLPAHMMHISLVTVPSIAALGYHGQKLVVDLDLQLPSFRQISQLLIGVAKHGVKEICFRQTYPKTPQPMLQRHKAGFPMPFASGGSSPRPAVGWV
jgi:hypothetical protein